MNTAYPATLTAMIWHRAFRFCGLSAMVLQRSMLPELNALVWARGVMPTAGPLDMGVGDGQMADFWHPLAMQKSGSHAKSFFAHPTKASGNNAAVCDSADFAVASAP